ncbi:hypothetical protein UlMin_001638 [Ulmus minor]
MAWCFRPKEDVIALPVVGKVVNDTLPIVEYEGSFSHGKYLIYVEGGDRCKNMNQYLWSFLCALGEAHSCMSSIYTNQDEEGKNSRFYFDFEHLRESTSVLDHTQFWAYWNKWQMKDRLNLHLVEDFRATPTKLANVKDALIMRKFDSVELDNYWYKVYEREIYIVRYCICNCMRLKWDYDSVDIVRRVKVRNKDLWPNLDRDTSPDALLSTLQDNIKDERNLYIAKNEPDKSFFDPLKDKYSTHFLDEYKDLWDKNNEWYS